MASYAEGSVPVADSAFDQVDDDSNDNATNEAATEQEESSSEQEMLKNRPIRKALGTWFVQYPRIMNLVFSVIIPLFALIGVTFLFGYSLAALEYSEEVASNDALMQNLFIEYGTYTSGAHACRHIP